MNLTLDFWDFLVHLSNSSNKLKYICTRLRSKIHQSTNSHTVDTCAPASQYSKSVTLPFFQRSACRVVYSVIPISTLFSFFFSLFFVCRRSNTIFSSPWTTTNSPVCNLTIVSPNDGFRSFPSLASLHHFTIVTHSFLTFGKDGAKSPIHSFITRC
ncbi:hypothetical protein F5B20DRAFT_527410 [Whalleya microplaca]|nr:hypothetical protein F5B20DRAFT_527410 [Whalleya microplaca]